jgi:transposase
VAQRAAFRARVAALEPERLVFVDESGVDTRLVRRYARAPAGARAVGTAPVSYDRLTIVGALSATGLVAPSTSERAMNTAAFLTYLDAGLIPTLVAEQPEAIVVLDNLRPHHAAAVREKLAAAGLGLLYLPPYSPDYTPIELAWSKVKTRLRTVAVRTRAALEAAVPPALATISGTAARGYFSHCGYNLL